MSLTLNDKNSDRIGTVALLMLALTYLMVGLWAATWAERMRLTDFALLLLPGVVLLRDVQNMLKRLTKSQMETVDA